MHFLKAFVRFWYDFIIGDDWVVAAGVVVLLVRRSDKLAVSQSLSTPSKLPLVIVRPPARTAPIWPSRVASSRPLGVSHSHATIATRGVRYRTIHCQNSHCPGLRSFAVRRFVLR